MTHNGQQTGSSEGAGCACPPLKPFIQAMRQAHGRDLSLFDETFLAKSLQKRFTGNTDAAAAAYLDRLTHDPAEAGALLQSLNIGYSEFFRNPLTFALLEQWILPGLAEAKGATDAPEIRIWSAGCATGQEAWSVAILLDDLAVALGRPFPSRIIATDVSEAALAVARQGVYEQAALQNVRLRHLRDHFAAQGGAFVIVPRIRERVDFSAYDLLDEHSVCPPASLYGDFDLIFCCNLLFYYRPEIRRRILDKLWRALAPGGYLVTGEAERDLVAKHEGFRAVAPPAVVFQKLKINREPNSLLI